MTRGSLIPGLLLITACAGWFTSYGQLREARQEMELYNFTGAIRYLEKALKDKNPARVQGATLLMATCYRKQNNFIKTKEWYEKTLDFPGAGPERIYYYALALRSLGDYENAKYWFLKYDSVEGGDRRGRMMAGWCDSAITWSKIPPRYLVSNAVSLNSGKSEFSVIRYGKGVLITTDRSSGQRNEPVYGWTGNGYLKLFYAEAEPSGNHCDYTQPVPADIPAFNQGHQGPVFYCNECGILLVTRSTRIKDKGRNEPGPFRTHLLKMFSMNLEDGQWCRAEPFFLNSDNYSVGHPTLTPALDTLIFISDMPGGYGGTDIYMCLRNGEKWHQPVNLGPEVNTSGNEMFPFASQSGMLYFSSDGLPGFGGLDIFSTRVNSGQWSIPANCGLAINSSFDDFALTTSTGDTSGWFSSNRPGGKGEDDIWCFRKIKPGPDLPPPAIVFADTLKPPLPASLELNIPYRIDNIYYDFDKWDIRTDAVAALDSLIRIMKRWPVKIELGSHTDCRGSDSYNLVLSQHRAESVVQYLVSQGIEPSRLTAKGYGETRLINGCNCILPDPCSEKEHQQNRRTEFIITGY